MKRNHSSLMFSRRRGNHDQSGIALITTLLLLMLLTAMVVAMVLTVNSDMLINGYYGNFKGGFYAGDAGLSIVRQSLANQLIAAIPVNFPPSLQPLPAGTEGTVLDSVIASYGTSYSSITSGQTSSWPSTFQMDSTKDASHASLTLLTCTATPVAAGGTCAAPCPTGCTTPATTPNNYTYIYNYHLLVYGKSLGAAKTALEESGSLTLAIPLIAAPNTPASFSSWGMFIDATPLCDKNSGYLVAGTISGPVFTNGAWNFGQNSSYTFTDSVGSVSTKAGFQNGNNCDQLTTGNDTNAGISPNYATPPKWGQAAVPLPQNDYNQQRAALDGIGTAGQPGNTDRAAVLRDADKNPYPSTGASTGVFLPYAYNSTTKISTFTGGGIMVEGDASVQLSTSGSTQTYIITQATGKTTTLTTTIVVDNLNKITTFKDDNSPIVTINGVPSLKDSAGNILAPATMLYVDGNITALSGPGEGTTTLATGKNTNPAIGDSTALTITASKDVTITGDIRYATEPVTTTANQLTCTPACPTPADTLIPGNDKGQYLGIFTATGNINLDNAQTSNNLQIDASLATISQGGTGGLVNTGDNITKLTIVGGRIQNTLKSINATTRNVYFDKRFALGEAPPWFPATSIAHPGLEATAGPSTSFQRLQWVNQTAYQQ